MKKYYLTYADHKFRRQRRIAVLAAKYIGRFDEIISVGPKDIDEKFRSKYQNILCQKRGSGYFIWKPYFICKVLSQISYGDILFYSDAGAFFIKNVDILINELNSYDQDIMGYELPLIEKQWTKMELFINMSCTSGQYYETNQILASFILIKKTIKSERFFNEFLYYATNSINLTDLFSPEIKQNKFFIEHRHDQSIFSLLFKSYNYKPFKDPSQLGKYPKGYSDCHSGKVEISELKLLESGRLFRINQYDEKYSMVLYHNKKGKPIKSLIKYLIKEILFKCNIYKGIVR